SPLPSAVVVPCEAPSLNTSTVLSASAVPLIVGVASVLTAPSLGLVMIGALGAIVSMTSMTTADSSLVLCAASVALVVMLCGPSDHALDGINVQSPFSSAIVVPCETPSLNTSTVLSPSAVPLIVGIASLLTVPSLGLVMLGALGAVVSITNVTSADSTPVLPAASVASAVMLCVPSGHSLVGVKVQSPLPSAVVVPCESPSLNSSTVLSASAVPLIVGVASLLTVPSLGLVILGALGAVVSILIVVANDSALVLPAASVAVTVMLCVASDHALVGVNVQSPVPSAIVVPCEVPSLNTSTVLSASAVPLIVGAASVLTVPSLGLVMLGALGAIVSMTRVTAADSLLVL